MCSAALFRGLKLAFHRFWSSKIWYLKWNNILTFFQSGYLFFCIKHQGLVPLTIHRGICGPHTYKKNRYYILFKVTHKKIIESCNFISQQVFRRKGQSQRGGRQSGCCAGAQWRMCEVREGARPLAWARTARVTTAGSACSWKASRAREPVETPRLSSAAASAT